MAWREAIVTRLRPGLFTGITLSDWLNLLWIRRRDISPAHWFRAASITLSSLHNSVFAGCEKRCFGSQFGDTPIPPPLFILGHWRSGTTHLQNLLATDVRFATPNLYQVAFPHAFLTTEPLLAKALGSLLPRTRPMDNVREHFDAPAEDEFAICMASFLSPYMSFVFPDRRDEYDRYLTFRGVPEETIEQWNSALLSFFRKLTWKYARPLVSKSPPHTCRIRLLLKLFPDARFIHIHRDPHAVFQSTKRQVTAALRSFALQSPDFDVDDWILRRYYRMYDAFFDERRLIPQGRFHEIRFEKLELDPLGEVRKTYQALALPDFAIAEPALQRYLASLSGYRRNQFSELQPELRQRISRMWRRCFEEWGYSRHPAPAGGRVQRRAA